MEQLIEAGIEEKNLKYFREQDPFNPGNEVEGYLARTGREHYGALEILKVNNEPVPQKLILCTPKIDYPFNREGNYEFPSAEHIMSFEKYDGTNIYCYQYHDAKYNFFHTYKIRQAPFLLDKFLVMWKEILERYPDIDELWYANIMNVFGYAFELYGMRNKHTIRYEKSLDIALLFGRGFGEEIIPLSQINALNVPVAEINRIIDKDYVWNYTQEQKDHDEKNTLVKSETSDLEEFEGVEGSVWYLKEKNTGLYRMFKCKSTMIQAIHWADDRVGRQVIAATAMNTLETNTEITFEGVVRLLSEEFDAEMIDRSTDRILKVISALTEESKLREIVRGLLQDFSPDLELPDIMRRIHPHFPKNEMRKVYGHANVVMAEKRRERDLEV